MNDQNFRLDSAGGIAMLTLMVALGQIAIGLYVPSLPSLVTYFGTDMGTVQLTLTVHFIGFAVFQLFMGPLSDRFGRRPVILGSLFVFAAGAAACALATGIWGLIAARLVLAIGASAGSAIPRAIVRDKTEGAESARIIAIIGMALAISPAITPSLGSQVYVHFGWQANFVLMAVLAVGLALYCYFKLPETNRHKDRDAIDVGAMLRNYRTLILDRRFLGYALATAAIFGALFAYQTGSPYLLMVRLGFTPQAFGLLILFNVVGFLIGNVLTSRYGPRIGTYPLVAMGAAVATLSGLAMLIPAYMGALSVYSVIGPSTLLLFAMGLTLPGAMAGAMQHFPHIAGAASALLGFLQMGTGAFGSLIVSSLQNGRPLVTAEVFAVMTGLGLVALLLIPRPRRHTA